MREFVLIDLGTQMPYLPREMCAWTQERLLAWLAVWGEVHFVEHSSSPERQHYGFISWTGRWTPFALTEDGRMRDTYGGAEAWADERSR